MPTSAPRPTLQSFLQAARWTVSRYMLSRVGSAKHDIRFVLPPTLPFDLLKTNDVFDNFKGLHFIHRRIDFGRIGMLCVSGTSPSIREIVFGATISDSSPLFFGTQTTLRTGFPEEDQYGTGKSYFHRVEFTKVADNSVKQSDLLVLAPGRVVFPLSGAAAGIVHKNLYERHQVEMSGDSVPLGVFPEKELDEINDAFCSLRSGILLDIAVILDSEELLAFHWTPSQGRFEEDYYNAGVTSAP